MRLLYSTLLINIVLALKVACAPLVLVEQLKSAQVGDFLVIQQGRSSSLLLVRSLENNLAIFEEISLPLHARPHGAQGWAMWLAQGAPYHTCWVAYLFNMQTGSIENTYSYSQGGWIDARSSDHFFSVLMTLRFSLVASASRKRVGPPGLMGKEEMRRPWNPPLIYEGHRLPSTDFTAYEALWPNDQSLLARARIVIYMPSSSPSYLSYFPYWIEASSPPHTLRVIDSGRLLYSPQPLPPMIPQVMNNLP